MAITRKIEIVNRLGLHARAAAVFVRTASAFSSEISVAGQGRQANGKSIMSVMMLQAVCGSELEITVTGEDEEAAMSAIAALVAGRFGEAE